MGNSFDGFAKAAAVQIVTSDEEQVMLAVVNSSNNLKIEWGINEKNGINNLSIQIIVPNDIKPQKVLMAFDDDRKYYIINFFYSNNKVFIENACSPDYNLFFSIIDIISFLKSRNKVHFRLYFDDQKIDFSFPLKGCSTAINQTFICPTYKRAGNWTDAAFELMSFQLMFSEVDSDKKNFSIVAPNCIAYLEKNNGLYFFTQIYNIESSTDDLKMLIFKNYNGEIISKISKEVYLKNLFYLSGSPKSSNGKKNTKDLETLRLYYTAFQKYTNLITDKISFNQFSNLTKKDLIFYYNLLLKNREFLDYMRSDKNTYIFYEVNEYNFNVFIEPWGL